MTTSIFVLTGFLLSALPTASLDDAPRRMGDSSATSELSRLSLAELKQRSRLLLDERPSGARYLGAVVMMVLGIPTMVGGVLFLASSGNTGGTFSFGGSGAITAGIGGLVLGIGLFVGGLLLALTGNQQQAAIARERKAIDDEVDRRRQLPSTDPSAERQLPLAPGPLLAHF